MPTYLISISLPRGLTLTEPIYIVCLLLLIVAGKTALVGVCLNMARVSILLLSLNSEALPPLC